MNIVLAGTSYVACKPKRHKKYCEKLSKENFHFSHLSYGVWPEAVGFTLDHICRNPLEREKIQPLVICPQFCLALGICQTSCGRIEGIMLWQKKGHAKKQVLGILDGVMIPNRTSTTNCYACGIWIWDTISKSSQLFEGIKKKKINGKSWERGHFRFENFQIKTGL